MLHAGKPLPAKKEQAHEGGFQKEGHQSFQSKRGAENIADVVAVIAPVHAELKFHHDAGGDAHGEIDAEQPAPEFRHVTPERTAGEHINRLHDGDQDRQPQR